LVKYGTLSELKRKINIRHYERREKTVRDKTDNTFGNGLMKIATAKRTLYNCHNTE